MGNIITSCITDKLRPTPIDEGYDTRLYIAAFNGKLIALRAWLDAGIDVNQANQEGKTLLYAAASQGHLGVVEALLAANADVDKPSQDGYTPLHRAVGRWDNYYAQSTVKVVRALLAKGADTEVASTAQATPLYTAITNMSLPQTGQRLGVVQALVESGANVNFLHPTEDQTPLIAAICNRDSYGGVEEALAIVNLLLAAKADPNQANKRGDTPLYEAAKRGYKEIVDIILVAHGADVDKRALKACPQLLMPLAARQAANDPVVAALTEKMAAAPDQPGLAGSGATAAGLASRRSARVIIKGCQRGGPLRRCNAIPLA